MYHELVTLWVKNLLFFDLNQKLTNDFPNRAASNIMLMLFNHSFRKKNRLSVQFVTRAFLKKAIWRPWSYMKERSVSFCVYIFWRPAQATQGSSNSLTLFYKGGIKTIPLGWLLCAILQRMPWIGWFHDFVPFNIWKVLGRPFLGFLFENFKNFYIDDFFHTKSKGGTLLYI